MFQGHRIAGRLATLATVCLLTVLASASTVGAHPQLPPGASSANLSQSDDGGRQRRGVPAKAATSVVVNFGDLARQERQQGAGRGAEEHVVIPFNRQPEE